MTTSPIIDQADAELLYDILYTLKEGNDDQRSEAVKNLVPKLRNKNDARERLIELLGCCPKEEEKSTPQYLAYEGYYREHYSEVRGWAATALAELCGTGDEAARANIEQRLVTELESMPRYWMLLALYRMGQPKDIQNVVDDIVSAYVKQSDADVDSSFEGQGPDNTRAGPLALAILASWKNQQAAQMLEAKLKSQNFYSMWSVCRALEVVSCREMLEPLRQVAEDPTTWPDIRNKCVKALGKIESPAAAQALGQVLAEAHDPIIKESVIEGLEHLGRSPSVRGMLALLEKTGKAPYSVADSLMVALTDSNAQIRRRAAEALPEVLIDLTTSKDGDGKAHEEALIRARTSATEKVISELVRERVDLQTGVPILVDALRVIDPPEADTAATVLTRPEYLYSDDVSVKQRAENALKLLGGEKALQTLMGQKSEVLRTYSDLLAKADEPIQELFKETMRQAQRSFSISQWMSIIIFGIGVLTLIAGLAVTFAGGQSELQRIFGAGASLVAVIAIVLDLLLRDPHKRVQEATSVILRIKVIFLGYMRQVHQLDATFKHEFIEGGREFGVKEAHETVKQISDVMKNTMDMIDLHLPVRKTEKLATDEVLKTWQDRLDAALKPVKEKVDALGEKK
jgi:HEAT repeat protein